MKNFRLLIKVLGMSIIAVILISIGFPYEGSERVSLGFIVGIIFLESVYYLAEKKTPEILLFTTSNLKAFKWNSIFLLSFSLIMITANIFYDGWILKTNFPMLIFLILGLRGLIFTKQTGGSIRVFKQGFEYGFWQRFVSWDRIINYKIQDDFIYLEKGNKRFKSNEVKLEFATSKDVILFEHILMGKKIKCLEN